MGALVNVITHTETALGAGGVFRDSPWQGSVQDNNLLRKERDGYALLQGYINSPQAGTLDIYQGSLADVLAITDAAPAAGVSNGILRHNTFAHPAGAANAGTIVAVQRVAPWVVVRFTNGGVAQASFRLHIEALE